jgi:hypothetical protein
MTCVFAAAAVRSMNAMEFLYGGCDGLLLSEGMG